MLRAQTYCQTLIADHKVGRFDLITGFIGYLQNAYITCCQLSFIGCGLLVVVIWCKLSFVMCSKTVCTHCWNKGRHWGLLFMFTLYVTVLIWLVSGNANYMYLLNYYFVTPVLLCNMLYIVSILPQLRIFRCTVWCCLLLIQVFKWVVVKLLKLLIDTSLFVQVVFRGHF